VPSLWHRCHLGEPLDFEVEGVEDPGLSDWRLAYAELPWVMPNFVFLDISRPDIAHLLVAMLQARQAVERRSWSHPQESTGEDWWADVLADPRARKRDRRVDKAVKHAAYRLSDDRAQPSS
jgi:hypothetical protein